MFAEQLVEGALVAESQVEGDAADGIACLRQEPTGFNESCSDNELGRAEPGQQAESAFELPGGKARATGQRGNSQRFTQSERTPPP